MVRDHCFERQTDISSSYTSDDLLTVTFHLPYAVEHEDECLYWMFDAPVSRRTQMTEHAGTWSVTVHLSVVELCDLKYRYAVCREGAIVRTEPPRGHRISIVPDTDGSVRSICIHDRWVEPSAWHRYSEDPLDRRMTGMRQSELPLPTITLSRGRYIGCYLPYHPEGVVGLCGSAEAFGSWDVTHRVSMSPARYALVCERSIDEEMEYKYVLQTPTGVIIWEEGDNRRCEPCPDSDSDMILMFVEAPRIRLLEAFPKTSIEGTVAPLFALRTERSYGIGDFGDAVDFVTWLRMVGHGVFQMLPFYDTTFTYTSEDSYPYRAITTYGLNPLYLDVRALPYYEQSPKRALWEERAKELNAAPRIKYEEVLKLKTEVIDACFGRWWQEEGYEEESFDDYWRAEHAQLLPYCLFCTLRDRSIGVQVEDYPPFGVVMEEWIAHRTVRGRDAVQEVMKHAFRQYHLDKQLLTLRHYADECGVMLKGDLPIGVSRNSVDVWQEPNLFFLNTEAGAPPDAFSTEGQNWGFPTYNWAQMAEEEYSWWHCRLSSMSRYLHALRIDHILGFFRIWTIPAKSGRPDEGHYVPAIGFPRADVSGLEQFFVPDEKGLMHPLLCPEGLEEYSLLAESERSRLIWLRDAYYYGRNERLWSQTALTRLSQILSASDMLICAEDLGLLPHNVKEVLRDLELLSLEVLRMPKRAGTTFVRPDDIPDLSVVTTSTHDTSSLRDWWQKLSIGERIGIAEAYGMSEYSPAALVRALRGVPCTMLILPLSDWCTLTGYGAEVLPEDEQINHPECRHHIWDYRMPGGISSLPTSLR